MIKIPDGENTPIYFFKNKITALRKMGGSDKTYLWVIGDDDPWIISCDVEEILKIMADSNE